MSGADLSIAAAQVLGDGRCVFVCELIIAQHLHIRPSHAQRTYTHII